jgi:uncharacterized protein
LSGAANDPAPFRTALTELFGTLTLNDVYRARHIALCIPAVNIEDRRSWVFETPHTPDRARGNYRVVDVCLATSAAPLYFPVAVIEDPSPSAPGQHHAFVDGGLWANNPIVIALVEALDLAPPGKSVEIISLTTCPPRTEDTVLPGKGANWGIWDWRVGIKALTASLDAQSSRYSGIVKALAPHLERPCRIVRLEPTSTAPELHFDIVMDRTSDEILAALARRAREDAKHYFAEARKYQRHHPFAGDPKDRRALRFDDFSILGATFDAMPTLGTAKRAAHHARTAPRQAPEAGVHTG